MSLNNGIKGFGISDESLNEEDQEATERPDSKGEASLPHDINDKSLSITDVQVETSNFGEGNLSAYEETSTACFETSAESSFSVRRYTNSRDSLIDQWSTHKGQDLQSELAGLGYSFPNTSDTTTTEMDDANESHDFESTHPKEGEDCRVLEDPSTTLDPKEDFIVKDNDLLNDSNIKRFDPANLKVINDTDESSINKDMDIEQFPKQQCNIQHDVVDNPNTSEDRAEHFTDSNCTEGGSIELADEMSENANYVTNDIEQIDVDYQAIEISSNDRVNIEFPEEQIGLGDAASDISSTGSSGNDIVHVFTDKDFVDLGSNCALSYGDIDSVATQTADNQPGVSDSAVVLSLTLQTTKEQSIVSNIFSVEDHGGKQSLEENETVNKNITIDEHTAEIAVIKEQTAPECSIFDYSVDGMNTLHHVSNQEENNRLEHHEEAQFDINSGVTDQNTIDPDILTNINDTETCDYGILFKSNSFSTITGETDIKQPEGNDQNVSFSSDQENVSSLNLFGNESLILQATKERSSASVISSVETFNNMNVVRQTDQLHCSNSELVQNTHSVEDNTESTEVKNTVDVYAEKDIKETVCNSNILQHENEQFDISYGVSVISSIDTDKDTNIIKEDGNHKSIVNDSENLPCTTVGKPFTEQTEEEVLTVDERIEKEAVNWNDKLDPVEFATKLHQEEDNPELIVHDIEDSPSTTVGTGVTIPTEDKALTVHETIEKETVNLIDEKDTMEFETNISKEEGNPEFIVHDTENSPCTTVGTSVTEQAEVEVLTVDETNISKEEGNPEFIVHDTENSPCTTVGTSVTEQAEVEVLTVDETNISKEEGNPEFIVHNTENSPCTTVGISVSEHAEVEVLTVDETIEKEKKSFIEIAEIKEHALLDEINILHHIFNKEENKSLEYHGNQCDISIGVSDQNLNDPSRLTNMNGQEICDFNIVDKDDSLSTTFREAGLGQTEVNNETVGTYTETDNVTSGSNWSLNHYDSEIPIIQSPKERSNASEVSSVEISDDINLLGESDFSRKTPLQNVNSAGDVSYEFYQEDNDLGATRYIESMSITTVVDNNCEHYDSSVSSGQCNMDYSSHEAMQQSMSEYITTQSLNLNIPDTSQIVNENASEDNEELRQQCVIQTDNVLLMKWPAKYYDHVQCLEKEIRTLSEQLECYQLKCIDTNNLKKENEDLLTKFEEVNTKFKESTDQNKILMSQIQQISESNKLLIENLKQENTTLSFELECFKNVKVDLNNLKEIHEESLKQLECLTEEKDKEIQVLVIKIGELEQHLSRIKQSTSVIEDERPNCLLLEEISNLKSQNELLWNEIKASTRKEEHLNMLKQERLKQEERLAEIKREMDEIDSIKINNLHLIKELEDKESQILVLKDDKKKFKSSLIKANKKLNELEAENEHLRELAQELNFNNEELKSQLVEVDKTTEQYQVLAAQVTSLLDNVKYLEDEKTELMNNLSILNESINSLLMDNQYLSNELAEKSKLYDDVMKQIQDIEKEKYQLNAQVSEKLCALEDLESRNSEQVKLIDDFRSNEQSLMSEINDCRLQLIEMDKLKDDNNALSSQVTLLLNNITDLEEEKVHYIRDLSSISEVICSFMDEKLLLSNELLEIDAMHSNIMRENTVLKEKTCLLSQNIESVEAAKIMVEIHNNELLNNENHYRDREILLKEELQTLKQQCTDIAEENKGLSFQNQSHINSINTLENNVHDFMTDLSSVSESLSSVFEENCFVSYQLELALNENLQLNALAKERVNITQEMSDLQLEKDCLLNKLELSNEKITSLEGLGKELQDHLTKINEELMNEIYNNHTVLAENEKLKGELEKTIEETYQSKALLLQVEEDLQNLKQQKVLAAEQHLELITEKEQFIQKLEYEQLDIKRHVETLKEEISELELRNEELKINYQNVLRTSNELHEKIEIFNSAFELKDQQLIDIQSEKDSLWNKLEEANEKSASLDDVTKELQDHLTKLNEELMFEISNNQSLLAENEKLSGELDKVNKKSIETQELLLLMDEDLQTMKRQSILIAEQHMEYSGEREQTIQELENGRLEFQKHISTLTEEINCLHSKNNELNIDFQNLLNVTDKLREENKSLNSLFESRNQDIENQCNDYKMLREILVREIHSLIGQNEDANIETFSVTDIFKKLMTEFISKEQEVISSLQHEYEIKNKTLCDEKIQLKSILNEKNAFIMNLEKEIENLKEMIKNLNKTISYHEHNLNEVKEELNQKLTELKETKENLVFVENCKETLLGEINNAQYSKVVSELEEQVSALQIEITCKSNEINDLKNEVETKRLAENDLLKRLEESNLLANQHQLVVDELTSKLNLDQELLSKYSTEIRELDISSKKLAHLEDEIKMIEKSLLNPLKADFGSILLEVAENSDSFKKIMKQIQVGWDAQVNKIQLQLSSFKLELAEKGDMCNSLETQVICLSEELRAQKMLYDEDVLQLKKEINEKNSIITNLTESNVTLKNDSESGTYIKELEAELALLREDKSKLSEAYANLKLFREVNGKLSSDVDDLSRAVKLEKQANVDLKTKWDSAVSQVSELKKRNYSLEDKICSLESKLQNQNILSSIKIAFPVEVNTFDKQVNLINDMLGEYEQLKIDLNTLKLEHKKSAEYIKRQDEKMSKILKRELDLKKQIASSRQNSSVEFKVLEDIKLKLVTNFGSEVSSLSEVATKINELIDENKSFKCMVPDVNELKFKFNEINQENQTLDEKCKIMHKNMKEQEAFLATVLEREETLKKTNSELKMQLKGPNHTGNSVINEDKLFELFPEKPSSFDDAVIMIKKALDEISSLKEQLTEAQDEYKGLDAECEQMFKAYQEKEQDLEDVLKREAALISDIKLKEEEHKERSNLLSDELKNLKSCANAKDIKQLLNIFPQKTSSLSDVIEMIENTLDEVTSLKEKLSEAQEEYKSLDNECENMFKAYQEKERDLADVLIREETLVSDMKLKEKQHKENISLLSDKLKLANSCTSPRDLEELFSVFPVESYTFKDALLIIKQTLVEDLLLKEQYKTLEKEHGEVLKANQEKDNKIAESMKRYTDGDCHCDELKSRLNELKMDIADRNAKITALELQFEADNFPLKKKIIDLEKTQDQLRAKNNELKAQVRSYQDQMHEVTVGLGLRAECERCRRPCRDVAVQTSPTTAAPTSNEEFLKEISILKCLCRSRKEKIDELQKELGYKLPRPQRSALKERKENTNVPPQSPSKMPKPGL